MNATMAGLELPESIAEMVVVPFTPGQITIGQRRAGIYVRISKDSARLGLGVERQLKTGRVIAGRMNWAEIDVYNDNDISASTKSKKPRPDFNRMMDDLRSGRINAVICLNLDRLTRRIVEGVGVFATFAELGIAYADNEGSDTITAEGRYRINMRLADAQREAERISERVKAAIEQRRENGQADPLATVFGFTHGTFMEHVEAEAVVIREMFRMASIGATVREVGTYCKSTGLAGKGGSDVWRPRQVHAVLRRAAYAGLVAVGNELVPAQNMKSVVTETIWRDVQAIMDKRAVPHLKVRQDYLMSGMVFCECGARMRAMAARRTTRGYMSTPMWVCRKAPDSGAACGRVSRSMQAIDKMVDAYMDEDFRENAATVAPLTTDNTEPIAALSGRVAGIQEAVRSGDADLIDATPILRSLRADIRALELEQASAVAQSAAQRSAAEMDKAAVWANDSQAMIPARRMLLRLAIGSIVVSRLPDKVGKAHGGPGREQAAQDSVAIIPA